VVEFAPSKFAANSSSVKAVIPQMAVDVTNAQGQMEAERHQVPLILAWVSVRPRSSASFFEFFLYYLT